MNEPGSCWVSMCMYDTKNTLVVEACHKQSCLDAGGAFAMSLPVHDTHSACPHCLECTLWWQCCSVLPLCQDTALLAVWGCCSQCPAALTTTPPACTAEVPGTQASSAAVILTWQSHLPDVSAPQGFTPLHVAIRRNSHSVVEVVRALVEGGATAATAAEPFCKVSGCTACKTPL